MQSMIISMIYTLAARLIQSGVFDMIKQEIISVSLERLEGVQKKIAVMEAVEEGIKREDSFKTYRNYILSMVIDICVAYLKEKKVIR